MLGLLVSSVVANSDRATSLIPVVLLPQVIFAGVIFSLDDPPIVLQILAGFFPARWAMAGLGSTEGLHGDKLGADSFSYWGTLFSNYSQGQAVFHLLLVWFILAAMMIILGFLIAWSLKKKDVRA